MKQKRFSYCWSSDRINATGHTVTLLIPRPDGQPGPDAGTRQLGYGELFGSVLEPS